MRLAVAQLRIPADPDTSGRLDATVGAIEAAADARAELVVLPELAACGYRLDPAHLAAHAEPADGSGAVLTRWRAAARHHGVAVVGGFAEALEAGDVANSVVVLDAGGEVAGVYRKLHLFGAERDLFRPGDLGLPLFDLAGTCVGVLVCYDLRFPEAARILALRGAEVLCVPTAWVAGFDRRPPTGERIPHVDGVVVQANLDQVFIACADQVGEEGDLRFLGRSVVVDPYGEVVGGPLAADAPATVTVDIDPTDSHKARDRGPGISPRENRRTDVYGELLGYRPQESR